MATKTTIERIADMTGETSDSVTARLSDFRNTGKLKKILEACISIKIEEARRALERPDNVEDMRMAQGEVKGLRSALAALDMGAEKS